MGNKQGKSKSKIDNTSEPTSAIIDRSNFTANQVYVVGKNVQGDLGLSNTKDTQLLQHLYHFHASNITNIYSGHQYTIYQDKENQLWMAGSYQPSISALEAPITTPQQIKYPNISNNCKKICLNVSLPKARIFWITNDNQIYKSGYDECSRGMGYDYLGGTTQKFHKDPILITTMLTYGFNIDIQCLEHYSVALGTDTEKLVPIYCNYFYCNYAARNNIPIDIVNVIITYCGTQRCFATSSFPGMVSYKKAKLYNGDEWLPVKECKDLNIVKIATGLTHCLFLEENGSVLSGHGINQYGQLGNGTFDSYGRNGLNFIEYFNNNDIKIIDIECGCHNCLAIDDKYNVYSWGDNRFGQCGNGTTKDQCTPQIIEHLQDYKIIEIKCGFHHCYARSDKDDHWLWGDNQFNQCLTNDSGNHFTVNRPHRINDIIEEETNGKINFVSLGVDNTKIILRSESW